MRLRTIGLAVKSSVYSCTVIVAARRATGQLARQRFITFDMLPTMSPVTPVPLVM